MTSDHLSSSGSTRKIIHCDCDCFYAAVEIRDNPHLQGLPVAVGGSVEKRGVIATCNYVARQHGVHSAMPTTQAFQRCPNLILRSPDMEKYREISKQILAIYHQYTPIVEPISLDEAYLDVTDSPHCQQSATLMAKAIREEVRRETGLIVSAGVAPNKFLAKVASDWDKPDGCFTVAPTQVDAFVKTLPIRHIPGVGPVTAQKLTGLGVTTCEDLQRWSLVTLYQHFGQFGKVLYDRARGMDARAVMPVRERKSISVELTFSRDLKTDEACHRAIRDLMERLAVRINRAQAMQVIEKQFIKIRFNDFRSTTVECHGNSLSEEVFLGLFDSGYQRNRKPVRLLGVGVRLSPDKSHHQTDLFNIASEIEHPIK